MKRIIGLVIALAVVVYLRSQVIENIHPWEWLWMLWVGSTVAVSVCLGWAMCEERHVRRHKSRSLSR